MSNSSLVTVTILSPNYNKRTKPITKITIHHMAAVGWTAKRCGECFAPASRKGSSNYGIGNDGSVGLYVDESNRAWTSGNAENDQMAVTIEVANSKGAPNWEVSDVAYAKLIDLCVDICQRNGIKELKWTGDKNGTLTCHYMFQSTACPGPYLKSKMPDIANQVNARLKGTKPQDDFIERIAGYVNQYRKKYNIMVASPIIAQAILESAKGTSELAVNANNYFGLKYRQGRCPTSNGTYVKNAFEQKPDGSYVVVNNTQWFKFPNMESGVIGYFDFTNIPNYYNLKGVSDPKTYLENIKADGYATSIDYVKNVMAVIDRYDLTQYDEDKPKPVPPSEFPYLVKIATDVLNVRIAPGVINEATGKENKITTTVRRGQVYTIVDEVNGWGKLKSGAGYICLAYTVRV